MKIEKKEKQLMPLIRTKDSDNHIKSLKKLKKQTTDFYY